ncbi:MFS transporter [Roseomonas alkaliterrae]|uniref:Putative MFS family arabinose efflux permease n=1 Tax=Neoroseomonas alkaliterrae TaxID=1452450 RepID=A0A840XXD4_9PROT|nr:putative MFS family arabinose efflux permease [Neoroseomonas alkaliterrae]MBR0677429.1 MFS transporter [Neoroseomonas alkaliterrae]
MRADLTLLPLLALAGFAAGGGMRLMDPLLPLLAADFRVGVAAVAPVVAGFSLAYGAGQLITGPLGDRYGKLRVAAIALLLYGLGLAASAAAWDLSSMIVLRTATGLVAGAVIPLAIAWIGDAVPYAERQATIGRFLTGMVMAQLLVGPLSGVVAEVAGWRASFLLLAAMALLVGGLMVRRAPAEAAAGRGRGLGLGQYLVLLRAPAGRRLMAAAALDGAALFGGAFPFVGAFLIERFGLSPGRAGLVVAGFGLGAFLYTRLAKRLVAWLGERGLVAAGGAGLAVALAGTAAAPGWWAVALLQVPMGCAFYMFHGVLQARASEALPEARATAVSAFAMALFLGQSLGALAFGAVLHAAGYGAVFAGAAVLTAWLAAWLARMPAR